MKQEYLIEINQEKNQLTIKEFAEAEPGILSLACKETYDRDHIESALKKGKTALISVFRTQNIYPPASFADKIAESIITLCGSPNGDAIELLLDDRDFLKPSRKKPKAVQDMEAVEVEAEPVEIDKLLEDDSADEATLDLEDVN